MHIILFGTGCDSCMEMAHQIENAIKAANIPVEFEKSNDLHRMLSYGIKSTPAVVVNGKVVSVGKKLSTEEIMIFLHEEI